MFFPVSLVLVKIVHLTVELCRFGTPPPSTSCHLHNRDFCCMQTALRCIALAFSRLFLSHRANLGRMTNPSGMTTPLDM